MITVTAYRSFKEMQISEKGILLQECGVMLLPKLQIPMIY